MLETGIENMCVTWIKFCTNTHACTHSHTHTRMHTYIHTNTYHILNHCWPLLSYLADCPGNVHHSLLLHLLQDIVNGDECTSATHTSTVCVCVCVCMHMCILIVCKMTISIFKKFSTNKFAYAYSKSKGCEETTGIRVFLYSFPT